jgi:hypothetical protein
VRGIPARFFIPPCFLCEHYNARSWRWDRVETNHAPRCDPSAYRGNPAVLLLPDILIEDLPKAPDEVRGLLDEIPECCLAQVFASEESMRLRDRYLSSGVGGLSCSSDAQHVAIATVVGADLLVCWNFKHIVHYAKIRGFSGVNHLEGYSPVVIRNPGEAAVDAEDQIF